jgi:amino-acid N-acetyltransferase
VDTVAEKSNSKVEPGAGEPGSSLSAVHDMVAWFRQSAPYINAHRGRTFVLMLSGDAIAHPNFNNIIHDIALLNSLGVRLVLALGARPQIDAQLAIEKIGAEFHQGLRVTPPEVMEVVKKASGVVRSNVEALLSTGVINSPMHGSSIQVVSGNHVTAKPIGVRYGIDFDHTGEVRKVAAHQIDEALKQNSIVLLPAIGYSPSGEVFNLSVEDVAVQAAISLKADKLIAFTESDGAMDEHGKLLRELRPTDCAKLLNTEGMPFASRQALRACYNAIDNGLPRSHLISYVNDGAMLAELFTRDGKGTLITQGSFEQIRKATVDDVGGVLELIQPLEEGGILVRRSRDQLEAEIEKFTVIERDGMIVACISLYPYVEEGSAEIACVATHNEYRGANRASILLHAQEQQAKELGINQLFVLTTQTAHWFLEKGFVESSLESLPVEKQKLYNLQRNSKIFSKNL